MQRGVEVIDRPRVRDDFLGGRGVGLARVGERGGRGFQPVEILDAFLVGDGEEHDVAALLGAADGEHTDARRGRRQCAAVGIGGRPNRPARPARRGFDAKKRAARARWRTRADRKPRAREKRGSVVAAAISFVAASSGVSAATSASGGAGDWACAQASGAQASKSAAAARTAAVIRLGKSIPSGRGPKRGR